MKRGGGGCGLDIRMSEEDSSDATKLDSRRPTTVGSRCSWDDNVDSEGIGIDSEPEASRVSTPLVLDFVVVMSTSMKHQMIRRTFVSAGIRSVRGCTIRRATKKNPS